MTTVLEEVLDDSIEAPYIRRRVEDWEARLNDLYAAIESWLPEGWTARHGSPVRMHERMMRDFGVPSKQIPTLLLESDSGRRARLEPRGLWIIGNNGRVDLRCGNRRYLITDGAESFQSPDWRAARSDARRKRLPVTESWLRDTLS